MYQIVWKLNGRKYPISFKFETLEDAAEEVGWWRENYPNCLYVIECL